MELFNITAGASSIVGLIIAIIMLRKVNQINNNINDQSSKSIEQKVKGKSNNVSIKNMKL